mmetsp:Transcript_64366/g.134317  ORF Transcript_64366/g.134317 Transcript_64366/m.134317 type:complete len:111 (-) Transcript_64366:1129-1461(-)
MTEKPPNFLKLMKPGVSHFTAVPWMQKQLCLFFCQMGCTTWLTTLIEESGCSQTPGIVRPPRSPGFFAEESGVLLGTPSLDDCPQTFSEGQPPFPLCIRNPHLDQLVPRL